MTFRDEQIRAAVAAQAAEWFAANDDTPLDARQSAALMAWLKASPLHVEELLGVASIARDLGAVGSHPDYSLETLLLRARAEDDSTRPSFWSQAQAVLGRVPNRRRALAVTAAALGIVVIASLVWRDVPRPTPVALPAEAAVRFETRPGEQQTRRLADGTVLYLDTATAVAVQYDNSRRRVTLISGQAAFEVVHEAGRPFQVVTGNVQVVDLGTRFAVRLDPDSTAVTVIEGRVSVAPPAMGRTVSAVELTADQQIIVRNDEWPPVAVHVDAQRATAWMHRELVFERAPLERVAAEFNRYSSKPIEITTPALRQLEISGVFSTDNTEELLAFLRSLDGVQVEVTTTRIRVSQK